MLDFLLYHTPIFYLIQSLWRDEAFSVLIAERSLQTVFGTLNFEPPIYYFLLHIWIRLFGISEISVRSLSLVGFALATVVVIFWSEKVFKKHWLSFITPIMFFFNPMLLYYAFEVRAYGWYMFFATLSIYAYSIKKYKLLTIANLLAFYTHTYAIFIPFSQCLHYFIVEKKMKISIRTLFNDFFVRSIVVWSVVITPWMYVILQEALKGRPTWYFPVDLQLVRSVLGNMFINYDGTPGNLWKYTAILSAILFVTTTFALKVRAYRNQTSYLWMTIFAPLTLVIGVSFFKPLFVNRYLIFVTIALVLLVAYSIFQIRNKKIQIFATISILLFSLAINSYFPSKRAKLDIRSTIKEANLLRSEQDLLYVSSPLIFFEAVYYTPDRQRVFLYNPEGYAFPWYVGESAFSESQMTQSLPNYPQKAVIINEDRSITIGYNSIINSIQTQQPLPVTN